MFLSEWLEFPSAPCFARKKKLGDISRFDVFEIARVPDVLPSLFSFLVGLRTYQHPGNRTVHRNNKNHFSDRVQKQIFSTFITMINTSIVFFLCERFGRLVYSGDEHRTVSEYSLKMSLICVHFLTKKFVGRKYLVIFSCKKILCT